MTTTYAPGLHVGFHTGAFNSAYFSFSRAADWAQAHGLHGIECGFVDGVSWNHGLGYFPHIASWEDPREIAEMLAHRNLALSQIDAAFPFSGPNGPSVALPYVINTIRWAALAGCPMVDTTDGLYPPDEMSDAEAIESMRRCFGEILETAARYDIVVNIETHGYFTSNDERMERLLEFGPAEILRITFDTGNTYIAGSDPVAFLRRFVDRVAHVHIKDVAPSLAEEQRGKQSGIGMSHSAVGGGVNAENIVGCLGILRDAGYSGAVALECDAAGGPVMEESIAWFTGQLDKLGYPHDIEARPPGAEKR